MGRKRRERWVCARAWGGDAGYAGLHAGAACAAWAGVEREGMEREARVGRV